MIDSSAVAVSSHLIWSFVASVKRNSFPDVEVHPIWFAGLAANLRLQSSRAKSEFNASAWKRQFWFPSVYTRCCGLTFSLQLCFVVTDVDAVDVAVVEGDVTSHP